MVSRNAAMVGEFLTAPAGEVIDFDDGRSSQRTPPGYLPARNARDRHRRPLQHRPEDHEPSPAPARSWAISRGLTGSGTASWCSTPAKDWTNRRSPRGTWTLPGTYEGLRLPHVAAPRRLSVIKRPRGGPYVRRSTTAPAGPPRASTAGRPRAASGIGPSGLASGEDQPSTSAPPAGGALDPLEDNSATHAVTPVTGSVTWCSRG
jgi:hypothetical protein